MESIYLISLPACLSFVIPPLLPLAFPSSFDFDFFWLRTGTDVYCGPYFDPIQSSNLLYARTMAGLIE